jgi:hypothetical protein
MSKDKDAVDEKSKPVEDKAPELKADAPSKPEGRVFAMNTSPSTFTFHHHEHGHSHPFPPGSSHWITKEDAVRLQGHINVLHG